MLELVEVQLHEAYVVAQIFIENSLVLVPLNYSRA